MVREKKCHLANFTHLCSNSNTMQELLYKKSINNAIIFLTTTPGRLDLQKAYH
jgi:hypothetical protein